MFSPNRAINSAINEMMPKFSKKSQRRMRKAILNAKKAALIHGDENTDAGARHIFREFLAGQLMNDMGFSFEYEQSFGNKTPDWIDENAGLLMESYTFERGGISPFTDRIVSAVSKKYEKYENVLKANSLRMVVAVYLDFLTGVTLEECREEIPTFLTMFRDKKSLWAIVFFTEKEIYQDQQKYASFCICRNPPTSEFPNWTIPTEVLSKIDVDSFET